MSTDTNWALEPNVNSLTPRAPTRMTPELEMARVESLKFYPVRSLRHLSIRAMPFRRAGRGDNRGGFNVAAPIAGPAAYLLSEMCPIRSSRTPQRAIKESLASRLHRTQFLGNLLPSLPRPKQHQQK